MISIQSYMENIQKMSINISQDPAKAIQQISDPILKLIEAKTDNYDGELKEQQLERLRK